MNLRFSKKSKYIYIYIRDYHKRALVSCNMDPTQLENLARYRIGWRSLCVAGVAEFEEEIRGALEGRQRQRHLQPANSAPDMFPLSPVPENLSFADRATISFSSLQKTDGDGWTECSSAMTDSLRKRWDIETEGCEEIFLCNLKKYIYPDQQLHQTMWKQICGGGSIIKIMKFNF